MKLIPRNNPLQTRLVISLLPRPDSASLERPLYTLCIREFSFCFSYSSSKLTAESEFVTPPLLAVALVVVPGGGVWACRAHQSPSKFAMACCSPGCPCCCFTALMSFEMRPFPRDIPLLVRYFVQDFARRMKKQIETIPAEAMNALVNWTWPGNVRELENIIERSVILSQGPILTVPLGELSLSPQDSFSDGTLENLRRESIVRVLRETGGVLSGPQGAAARLGLKRTTLQSRMQKLGISREEYENQQRNKEHEN
jgi:hypothetical protein